MEIRERELKAQSIYKYIREKFSAFENGKVRIMFNEAEGALRH